MRHQPKDTHLRSLGLESTHILCSDKRGIVAQLRVAAHNYKVSSSGIAAKALQNQKIRVIQEGEKTLKNVQTKVSELLRSVPIGYRLGGLTTPSVRDEEQE